MAVLDGAFGDLRKLADWFSTSPQRSSLHIERIVRRLGATCVPLLGRELSSRDLRRREAARDCLAMVATADGTRERVIEELRAILDEHTGDANDELKVVTLGLLAELGAHAEARFEDPRAMQRRSAIALAAQLDTPVDVASAADMMVRQLDATSIAQMVEALSESAPDAALRLSTELGVRLDLDLDIRERILAITSDIGAARGSQEPRGQPSGYRGLAQVAVLVDCSARFVVVASRKLAGERRWRRWAVLIGPAGQIDDCIHEETSSRSGRSPAGADADAAPLIASLVADGYRIASTDHDHARTVVAAAARISATRPDPQSLPSAYYVGRDLLDLGDAHMGLRRDPSTLAVARAIELIADGEHARALVLLARSEAGEANADHHAAVAACALVQGRHADAVEPLGRAIAIEPAWPLHHWNLAVACHALGDAAGTYHALRRFIATSARPSALHGDPDQPARIAFAELRLVELERAARLAGTRLRTRADRSRTRRKRTKRSSK